MLKLQMDCKLGYQVVIAGNYSHGNWWIIRSQQEINFGTSMSFI